MLDTALCSCGSGLRRVRCCGLDETALADPANLTLLDAAAGEATKFFNEKKQPEAEAAALRVLDIAPNHRGALRVLFELRRAENKVQAAEVLARRLAALPDAAASVVAGANLQLAQLLIGQSRYLDAEPAARKAVIAAPRDASGHHVMGVVLTETGRCPAGEKHYLRALQLLDREDGTVLANLAWNLKLQGRLEEAAAAYQRALVLRPDNSRAAGGFAQVEMARGNAHAAVRLLDDAVGRWPADRALRLLRVMADLHLGAPDAALARLGDAAETLMPAELAARGQAYAQQGQLVEAVRCYAQVKTTQRERFGQSYQPAAFISKAENYKAYFTADRLLAMPRAAPALGPQPLFLLGFARSGTALLEQLLAQVPGFAAGDDVYPVETLTRLVPELAGAGGSDMPDYPEALDHSLIGEGLDLPGVLRSRYLAVRTAAMFGAARFITDRAATNPWHLGLVKLLFPDAPVIHLLRHPLDVMLSNLSQEQRYEANSNVSMLARAKHYDLVMSMIRHYRGQLTLRYLPVRYEDLVSAPAETIARVVQFAGGNAGAVPPAGVLAANQGALPARVPAHFAARRKIDASGCYRYRAYEAVLPNLFAEIRPVLEPWIAELGYGAAP